MATSGFDTLFANARNASQEDIDRLCAGILDTLGEKSQECLNQLRQLFFIIHASNTEPCIPEKLVKMMYQVLVNAEKSKIRQCLLCQQILLKMLPNEEEMYTVKNMEEPSFFPLHLMQTKKNVCFDKMIPGLIRYMQAQNQDFETQRNIFSFLVAISLFHDKLLTEENIKMTNVFISEWLMNASLFQASNPYSINILKKGQTTLVNEMDGAPSRNFFTVLNIGQFYTEDQFLNIYTFSLLYKWLHHTYSSTKKTSAFENSDSKVSSTCLKIYAALIGRTVEYCFRVLDQCERKSKVTVDVELQYACLTETISILDVICKIDNSQTTKVFQEIKRVFSRVSQDNSQFRILINILQFYINHSASVVHDPHEAYHHFFGHCLSQFYDDPALSFDMMMLIRENLEVLCYNTDILQKYFPNILKIVAWNPRTYMTDIVDILPAMMSLTTSLELFHTLLDLPCMTASLVISQKVQKGDGATQSVITIDSIPTSSTEAFQHPLQRPLFNFITRVEGGHGDTIDRLNNLYELLEDMTKQPQVLICCQVALVLLRVWFSVILEEGNSTFISHLIPALLERSKLLYNIPDYQNDIRRILSDNLILLLKKYPEIIVEQFTEISDFLTNTRNIVNSENFYGNLVWSIGELCSPSHHEQCSTEWICHYYETLETLSYEVTSHTSSINDEKIPPKISSTLMSSIAKLASRSQDLIPRAILCLTKFAKQQYADTSNNEERDYLIFRAEELINLLKIPNFASVVLNPSQEIETGRWHKDNTSIPVLLRQTHRMVCHDAL